MHIFDAHLPSNRHAARSALALPPTSVLLLALWLERKAGGERVGGERVGCEELNAEMKAGRRG